MQPGYMTGQAIDRLERNQRVTGHTPPEFGGEAGTNVRTGRRGDSIMSSTVDFTVQEAQVTMAAALEKANRHAIAIDREYFGPRKKTWYVTGYTRKPRAEDEYTPSQLWTTDRHTVTYSHPGSDTNQLTIAALQLVGAELMAKQSAMELHPMIDDPEQEHDRIQAEGLEKALLTSLEQQASQGAIPPSDLARIMQLVRDDDVDLADAIVKVQKEAQERQATQAPPGSPETQPGLAQPGAGAEQPTIPQVAEGQRNLMSLMSSSRLPQMALPQEMGNASQISGINPSFGA
jgi:hypothetical protein